MHPGLVHSDRARVYASVTITTGRFHEVRRLFAALHSEVVALCRVAFGGVELPPALEAGAWTEIDLKALFRGLSPRVPRPIVYFSTWGAEGSRHRRRSPS